VSSFCPEKRSYQQYINMGLGLYTAPLSMDSKSAAFQRALDEINKA